MLALAVAIRRQGLVLVCLVLAACAAILYLTRIPDLSRFEAAKIISRTPEFNRNARLLNVERVDHLKDSMDSVSFGLFTFVHLDAAQDSSPVKGWADFRYWDREWHLSQFDYGCDHSGLDRTMRATAATPFIATTPPK